MAAALEEALDLAVLVLSRMGLEICGLIEGVLLPRRRRVVGDLMALTWLIWVVCECCSNGDSVKLVGNNM